MSDSSDLADRQWRVSRRLARALEKHYLPDDSDVRTARQALRVALALEPADVVEVELVAYRELALARFETALGLKHEVA